MPELARVLDPESLDHGSGPRGRMTIDILAAWLLAGDTIEIVVPSRLVCDRCEGGGCDACSRSGAIRLALNEPARTIRLALSRQEGTHMRVRLLRPLGDDAGLEQLSIEVRAASEASDCCRRLGREAAMTRGLTTRSVVFAVAVVALAIALALRLR